MDAAWSLAVKRGDLTAVLNHLNRGGDVNARDKYGQTALMLAARAGQEAIVDVLLEREASLNVTAKYGLSALMLAVINQHVSIARRLARAGADLSLRGTGAPGFYNKTAFDLATARGMLELATDLKPK